MKVTLSRKLIALMAVMISAIVGVLSTHLPARHIEDMEAGMIAKAETYGTLLSTQVRSAVAFDDKETAREVLTSLSADPHVVSVFLFGADGALLYSQGEPSDWHQKARFGVRTSQSFRLGDRIVEVAPVESLEGPRGTLIVELSRVEMHARAQAVRAAAMGTGGLALAFGVLAAWLIARSLSRRLHAMGKVAGAMAEGARHLEVIDRSSDEIGALARMFNAMTSQLQAREEALERVNRELEDRVEVRTRELKATNAQLVDEMKQRSRMELELRQAQKLESVGRLAAGIAHEINTPVQFVSDSCHFIRSGTSDLARAIQKLTALIPPEKQSEVEELATELDLEFLLEQMPASADRALDGLGRVAAIVRATKEFAHPEQKEKAHADLNRAIESTLMISTSEYKLVADVKTELGEVPLVLCHLGEINQAVLNIVVNAAHAIEDRVRGTDRRGEIMVQTGLDGDDAFIKIRDTGGGIRPEILDRIFDPFFTTKEVGKGTGQGLAIARSVVVDKHGGKLLVDSELGVGTTFTIRLPLEQRSH